MKFVFLRLPYFTWYHVLRVYPCGHKWQDNTLACVSLLVINLPACVCLKRKSLSSLGRMFLLGTESWVDQVFLSGTLKMGLHSLITCVISEMKFAIILFVPSYRVFHFAFILYAFVILSLSLVFSGSLGVIYFLFLVLGDL